MAPTSTTDETKSGCSASKVETIGFGCGIIFAAPCRIRNSGEGSGCRRNSAFFKLFEGLIGGADGLGRGGVELFEGRTVELCEDLGSRAKQGAHEGLGSAYGFPGIPGRIHVRCGAMWAHMTV